jgi:hypothetical protein
MPSVMPGLIASERFRQPSGRETGSTLLPAGGTFGPDATVPMGRDPRGDGGATWETRVVMSVRVISTLADHKGAGSP